MIDAFSRPLPISLKVAEFLRNAIIHGELKPGERLNEALLSSKLGISRSPIREAFRILESENLVQIYSRKGTFVSTLSARDIEEISQILSAIEGTAARLAAGHIDNHRQKELKGIVRQLERSARKHNTEVYASSTMRLHNFIIDASRNRLLRKTYNYLEAQRERLKRAIKFDEGNLAKSLREHIAISKALLEGDGKEAERLLRDHYHQGSLRLMRTLKDKRATAPNERMPQ